MSFSISEWTRILTLSSFLHERAEGPCEYLPEQANPFYPFQRRLPNLQGFSVEISSDKPACVKESESEVAQSCLTLCDPMDCSPPHSSISKSTISFSRGSSQPRDWTWVSCIVGRCFTIWATREVCVYTLFFFLAVLQGLWKLCSLTRDWTQALGSDESMES